MDQAGPEEEAGVTALPPEPGELGVVSSSSSTTQDLAFVFGGKWVLGAGKP